MGTMQSLAADWPARSGREYILQQHLTSEEVGRAQACILHLFRTAGGECPEGGNRLREFVRCPGQLRPPPFKWNETGASVGYTYSSRARQPFRKFGAIESVILGETGSGGCFSELSQQHSPDSSCLTPAPVPESPAAKLFHYCVCALTDISRTCGSLVPYSELDCHKFASNSASLRGSPVSQLPEPPRSHCSFVRDVDNEAEKFRHARAVEWIAPTESDPDGQTVRRFASEDPGNRVLQPVWHVYNPTIVPTKDCVCEALGGRPFRQLHTCDNSGTGGGIAGAVNCIGAQTVDTRLEPVLIDDVEHPLRLATPPLLRCVALRFRREAQPVPAAHSVPQVLGELVGEVTTADEQAGRFLCGAADDQGEIQHEVKSALNKVCNSIDITIHFSPEALHSLLRSNDRRLNQEAQAASTSSQRACTRKLAEDRRADPSNLQLTANGDSQLTRLHAETGRGGGNPDEDAEPSPGCSFRQRKMLLPAPGRYILRTHRRCNMLAFVQHFELPRYDSLEPLNVQQNCQLHTIYLNGWPHFVLTSVPGVAIQPGDLLFCDLGAGFFRSRRRALARQLALIARVDFSASLRFSASMLHNESKSGMEAASVADTSTPRAHPQPEEDQKQSRQPDEASGRAGEQAESITTSALCTATGNPRTGPEEHIENKGSAPSALSLSSPCGSVPVNSAFNFLRAEASGTADDILLRCQECLRVRSDSERGQDSGQRAAVKRTWSESGNHGTSPTAGNLIRCSSCGAPFHSHCVFGAESEFEIGEELEGWVCHDCLRLAHRVHETLQNQQARHRVHLPSLFCLESDHVGDTETDRGQLATVPRSTLSLETQGWVEEASISDLQGSRCSRPDALHHAELSECEHGVSFRRDSVGPASTEVAACGALGDLPETEKLIRQLRPCRACFREASTVAKVHGKRRRPGSRAATLSRVRPSASLSFRMGLSAACRRNCGLTLRAENYRPPKNSRGWIAEIGVVCRLRKGHVYAPDFDDLSGCAAPLRKAVKTYRILVTALSASLSRREMLRSALREVRFGRIALPRKAATKRPLPEESARPEAVTGVAVSDCRNCPGTGQERVLPQAGVCGSCVPGWREQENPSAPPRTQAASSKTYEGRLVLWKSAESLSGDCTKAHVADSHRASEHSNLSLKQQVRQSTFPLRNTGVAHSQGREKHAPHPNKGGPPQSDTGGILPGVPVPTITDKSTLRQPLQPPASSCEADEGGAVHRSGSLGSHDAGSRARRESFGARCSMRPSDETLPAETQLEVRNSSMKERPNSAKGKHNLSGSAEFQVPSRDESAARPVIVNQSCEVSDTQAAEVGDATVLSPRQPHSSPREARDANSAPSAPHVSPRRAQAPQNPLSRAERSVEDAPMLRQYGQQHQPWHLAEFSPHHPLSPRLLQQQHVRGVRNSSFLGVHLQEQNAGGTTPGTPVAASPQQPTPRPELPPCAGPNTFQAAPTSTVSPSTPLLWNTVPIDCRTRARQGWPVSPSGASNRYVETPSWPGVVQGSLPTRAAWPPGIDPRTALWTHPLLLQPQVFSQQLRAASQARWVAEQGTTSPQVPQGYVDPCLRHWFPPSSPVCHPQLRKESAGRAETGETGSSVSSDALTGQKQRTVPPWLQYQEAIGAQQGAAAQPKSPCGAQTVGCQKDPTVPGPLPGSQHISFWPQQMSPSVQLGHHQPGENMPFGQKEKQPRLAMLPQHLQQSVYHHNWLQLQHLYGHQQSQLDTAKYLPPLNPLAGTSESGAGPSQVSLQTPLVQQLPQMWRAPFAWPNTAHPQFLMPAPMARLPRSTGQRQTQAAHRGPRAVQGGERGKAVSYQKKNEQRTTPGAGPARTPNTATSTTGAVPDPPTKYPAEVLEPGPSPTLDPSRSLAPSLSPHPEKTCNQGPGVPSNSLLPSTTPQASPASQAPGISPSSQSSREVVAPPCTGLTTVQPPFTASCRSAPSAQEKKHAEAAFGEATSAPADADAQRHFTDEEPEHLIPRGPERVRSIPGQPAIQAQPAHAQLFSTDTTSPGHALPRGIHRGVPKEIEPTSTELLPQRPSTSQQLSASLQSPTQETSEQENADGKEPAQRQAEKPEQDRSVGPHPTWVGTVSAERQVTHTLPPSGTEPAPVFTVGVLRTDTSTEDGGQRPEEVKQYRIPENGRELVRVEAMHVVVPVCRSEQADPEENSWSHATRDSQETRRNKVIHSEPSPQGELSEAQAETAAISERVQGELDEAVSEKIEQQICQSVYKSSAGSLEDNEKGGTSSLPSCGVCSRVPSRIEEMEHGRSNPQGVSSTPAVLLRLPASSVAGEEVGKNDLESYALHGVPQKGLGSTAASTQGPHQEAEKKTGMFPLSERQSPSNCLEQPPVPQNPSPSPSSRNTATIQPTGIALPQCGSGGVVEPEENRYEARTYFYSVGHPGAQPAHPPQLRAHEVPAESSAGSDRLYHSLHPERLTAGEGEQLGSGNQSTSHEGLEPAKLSITEQLCLGEAQDDAHTIDTPLTRDAVKETTEKLPTRLPRSVKGRGSLEKEQQVRKPCGTGDVRQFTESTERQKLPGAEDEARESASKISWSEKLAGERGDREKQLDGGTHGRSDENAGRDSKKLQGAGDVDVVNDKEETSARSLAHEPDTGNALDCRESDEAVNMEEREKRLTETTEATNISPNLEVASEDGGQECGHEKEGTNGKLMASTADSITSTHATAAADQEESNRPGAVDMTKVDTPRVERRAEGKVRRKVKPRTAGSGKSRRTCSPFTQSTVKEGATHKDSETNNAESGASTPSVPEELEEDPNRSSDETAVKVLIEEGKDDHIAGNTLKRMTPCLGASFISARADEVGERKSDTANHESLSLCSEGTHPTTGNEHNKGSQKRRRTLSADMKKSKKERRTERREAERTRRGFPTTVASTVSPGGTTVATPEEDASSSRASQESQEQQKEVPSPGPILAAPSETPSTQGISPTVNVIHNAERSLAPSVVQSFSTPLHRKRRETCGSIRTLPRNKDAPPSCEIRVLLTSEESTEPRANEREERPVHPVRQGKTDHTHARQRTEDNASPAEVREPSLKVSTDDQGTLRAAVSCDAPSLQDQEQCHLWARRPNGLDTKRTGPTEENAKRAHMQCLSPTLDKPRLTGDSSMTGQGQQEGWERDGLRGNSDEETNSTNANAENHSESCSTREVDRPHTRSLLVSPQGVSAPATRGEAEPPGKAVELQVSACLSQGGVLADTLQGSDNFVLLPSTRSPSHPFPKEVSEKKKQGIRSSEKRSSSPPPLGTVDKKMKKPPSEPDSPQVAGAPLGPDAVVNEKNLAGGASARLLSPENSAGERSPRQTTGKKVTPRGLAKSQEDFAGLPSYSANGSDSPQCPTPDNRSQSTHTQVSEASDISREAEALVEAFFLKQQREQREMLQKEKRKDNRTLANKEQCHLEEQENPAAKPIDERSGFTASECGGEVGMEKCPPDFLRIRGGPRGRIRWNVKSASFVVSTPPPFRGRCIRKRFSLGQHGNVSDTFAKAEAWLSEHLRGRDLGSGKENTDIPENEQEEEEEESSQEQDHADKNGPLRRSSRLRHSEDKEACRAKRAR